MKYFLVAFGNRDSYRRMKYRLMETRLFLLAWALAGSGVTRGEHLDKLLHPSQEHFEAMNDLLSGVER